MVTPNDRHLVCGACGLYHRAVEAGGIWHCPNPLCPGPGAAYFRSKLDSFRKVENFKHEVDIEEWIPKAEARVKEIDDADITAAFLRCRRYWLGEIPSPKSGTGRYIDKVLEKQTERGIEDADFSSRIAMLDL